MKNLLLVAVVLFVGEMSMQRASASDASLDARIQDCFRAHAQLMEKPGLRNLVTCWRAHSYLMERR